MAGFLGQADTAETFALCNVVSENGFMPGTWSITINFHHVYSGICKLVVESRALAIRTRGSG